MATISIRKNSRNAKRVADMKQMASALNLAYLSNNGYPDSSASGFGGWACVSSACTGGWSARVLNATVDAVMFPAFMASKPTDPLDSTRTLSGYQYDINWGGGSAPYDSSNLSGGPTLTYAIEAGSVCTYGKTWYQDGTRSECYVAIDGRF